MRFLVELVDTESHMHGAVTSWDQCLIGVFIEASTRKVDTILACNVIGYHKISEPLVIGYIQWA